jgi:hypothetical protein
MTQLNDAPATERALIVSSDGHATAEMRDYFPRGDVHKPLATAF